MKKAFDTKVYFRDGWLKNYTFVYVKTKIHAWAHLKKAFYENVLLIVISYKDQI